MIDPYVFVSEATDESGAAEELAAGVASLGVENPFILSSRHGSKLAAALNARHPVVVPNPRADQAWAAEFGSRAHKEEAGTIVAIGGGRCLDVAKLAAARAGLTLIVVPTQLSHDGICSPVAVVPDAEGRAQSIGAVEPRAVFLSLPTIAGAPPASVRAGIGDLLANPLALRDWSLAAERGLEEVSPSAWDMSAEAFTKIEPFLDDDPADYLLRTDFLRTLADALILSGLAMIASGTSRPASGGEHEISHAIDHLLGGRAMHGAQVAFGCIFSVALYGDDTDAFRTRLHKLGLPQHPRDLGLSEEETVEIVLGAPNTRPGRYTIIEAADLDRSGATALIRKIWPS